MDCSLRNHLFSAIRKFFRKSNISYTLILKRVTGLEMLVFPKICVNNKWRIHYMKAIRISFLCER